MDRLVDRQLVSQHRATHGPAQLLKSHFNLNSHPQTCRSKVAIGLKPATAI